MSIFKNKKLTACAVFFIMLYLVWILKAFFLNPALSQVIEKNSVAWYLLSDGLIKNLCWTLPAVLLIKKFNSELYLPKEELFGKPDNLKGFLPVLGIMTACQVITSVIHHGGLYFNSDGLTECIAFLFVGITEEFVFRGFLLNAVITEKNRESAILVNAVLFLSIHFPSWIVHETFIPNFQNFGFVMIILLSIFFSWSMLKFRNIWYPVILHSVWDIFVTLLN